MKRKNLMTALMCTFCMAVTAAAPMAAMAEETEIETEAAAEEDTEADTEKEIPARPDYTAMDYVTLGEYKGLEVTKPSSQVTEEEIQDELEYNIRLADALETVTEGTVQEGDTANIDYEGKKDDVAFDGGTAKGYDLIIGSGSFIDGFEDGLVGVAVGETVDLPLTFPENYGNSELAGQDVVFTVTVNEIKRIPELTAELVSTISDGEYSDVDTYREYIRSKLAEDKEASQESQMKSDLMTMVANVCEVKEYPQEMVDYGMANMDDYYRSMASYYSMEFDEFLTTYLGMTEEQFEEEALEAVKMNLDQEMYLKAIAENEGMELSEEEYKTESDELAGQYGYETGEELAAAYGEDTVRTSILQNKVMDFLLDNAVVKDGDAEAESETEA